MPVRSRSSVLAVAASALAILFVYEWRLFAVFVRDFVLPLYPDGHDQVTYLLRSFAVYFEIQEKGVAQAFVAHVGNGDALGSLLDFEGAIAYSLVSPDRLGALSVNFLHFALLEVGTFCILAWLTGSIAFGFVGVALLLSSHLGYVRFGGLFDFRLDFAAACAYGLLVATILRSRCFQSLGWSAASGVVAGYLVGVRHNTIAYVVGLYAALIATSFVLDRLRRHRDDPYAGSHRRGALVALTTVALSTGVFVIASYDKVIGYYAAQFATRGPARNALESRDLLEHYLFYPAVVYELFLGQLPVVFAVAVACLVLWALAARWLTGAEAATRSRRDFDHLVAYWIVALSILVPLTVLTVHSARSTAVARIVLPSMVFMATMLLADGTVWIYGRPIRDGRVRASLVLTSLALLVVGASAHAAQYDLRRTSMEGIFSDRKAALEMHAVIGRLAGRLGLRTPTFILNSLRDSLTPRIAATVMFERERRLLLPRTATIHNQIFAKPESFWDDVRRSDFILLQTRGEKIRYPYVEYVDSIADVLGPYVARNFIKVGEWSFGDTAATAYVAPRMNLELGVNLEREEAGPVAFSVSIPRVMLESHPDLTLTGSGAVAASVRLRKVVREDGGGDLADVRGEMVIEGGRYRIEMHFDPEELGDAEVVTVRIEIDVPPSQIVPSPTSGTFALSKAN